LKGRTRSRRSMGTRKASAIRAGREVLHPRAARPGRKGEKWKSSKEKREEGKRPLDRGSASPCCRGGSASHRLDAKKKDRKTWEVKLCPCACGWEEKGKERNRGKQGRTRYIKKKKCCLCLKGRRSARKENRQGERAGRTYLASRKKETSSFPIRWGRCMAKKGRQEA